MPHYPEAYLESKHCKIFAHWRTPRGVSACAYLRAVCVAFGMRIPAASHCMTIGCGTPSHL